MRTPRIWNRQAQSLFLGLFFLAVLLPYSRAYGIQGFDKFRKFKQIYEPSGIIQLADERFVVVEDEASTPLDIFTLDNEGKTQETYLARSSFFSFSTDRALNALDDLEARLAQRRYLAGDQVSEADWRLFPTLVRFDAVYYNHFKTNRQRLMDFPNLWAYTRELYQVPGIAETVNMDHIVAVNVGDDSTVNGDQDIARLQAAAIGRTTGNDLNDFHDLIRKQVEFANCSSVFSRRAKPTTFRFGGRSPSTAML